MSKDKMVFYYRGEIERVAVRKYEKGPFSYRWHAGYSMNSEDGNPLYPWSTKRECQAEARQAKRTAVFIRGLPL